MDIEEQIEAILKRRLAMAGAYLDAKLKEVLSVPAPSRRSKTGRLYATTRATPGAPPRMLSGRLRASVAFEVDGDKWALRVGTNVVYGRVHEDGRYPGSPGGGAHPWLRKTIAKEMPNIMRILRTGNA